MFKQLTIDQLIQLRLSAMAFAYREQDKEPAFASMAFDERFSLLVEAEYDARKQNKRKRLIKAARLSDPDAVIEDVLYYPDRMLNKEQIVNLGHGNWIDEHQNILLTGASGSGKSWLACAFANRTIDQYRSVVYTRLPELLDKMSAPKDDLWLKDKRRYLNCDVLVLDDFLLEPIEIHQARELLEIVEGRHRKSSLIVCSQFSPAGWHENILSEPIADATLDRLLYSSHHIHIEGNESMRKRMSKLSD